MKSLILIAILSLGFTPSRAQNTTKKAESSKEQANTTFNTGSSDVSDAQKEELKALFEKHQAQRPNPEGKTKEELKEIMKAYHNEHKKEVKALLDKHQSENVNTFNKEHHKQILLERKTPQK